MEQDFFFESYQRFQRELNNDSNCEIVLNEVCQVSNKRFYFDLVVKSKGQVVAIVEYKKLLNETNKGRICDQCQEYLNAYSDARPIIVIGTPNGYYKFENKECLYKIDKTELFGEIRNRVNEITVVKIDKRRLIEVINESLCKDNLKTFINSIQDKHEDDVFDHDSKNFFFRPKYEIAFFKNLLGKVNADTLYRYTTLDVLFKTLSSKKQSLVSIMAMTDSTEVYYANSYLKERIKKNDNDTISIKSQFEKASRCFIMSCVDIEHENIKMWQDYGDSERGVRITYTKNRNHYDNLLVAPVCYANEKDHPELELIAKMRNIGWGIKDWDKWQHFFKPYEFRDEHETRIMYVLDDNSSSEDLFWLNKNGKLFPLLSFPISKNQERIFPYSISKIIFGPRSSSDTDKQVVVKQLLLENDIDTNNTDSELLIGTSEIWKKYPWYNCGKKCEINNDN